MNNLSLSLRMPERLGFQLPDSNKCERRASILPFDSAKSALSNKNENITTALDRSMSGAC